MRGLVFLRMLMNNPGVTVLPALGSQLCEVLRHIGH
jgi:hypothetical protein